MLSTQKYWLKWIGVAVLLLTLVCATIIIKDNVFAVEPWEIAFNKRKSDVEGKINSINQQVETYNASIYDLKRQQNQLADELKTIQSQITTTDKLIQDTKTEIQNTEIQIDDNNKQLDILKAQLKEVFVEIQSSQVDSLVEVLLSSQNLDEVLGRINALDTLQTKLNILRSQTTSKIKELESNKDLLTQSQDSLSKTQAFNQSRRDQQATLLEKTKGQQSEYEKLVNNLSQQENSFQAEIAQIDADKLAEAQRIAKERDRQGGGTRAPGGGDPGGGDFNACNQVNEAVDLTGIPDSSNFVEPTTGYITVGFGCVPFYLYGVHDAIDIGNGVGTPIISIANGVVVQASYKGAFGNRIIVKHTFGNRRIYSLYAHLSSMDVSVGQTVTKGQQIGGMGNTGNSFGSHLHFTIMDETYEITRLETCTKKWGSFTYCYDPFLTPFRFF